MCKNYTNLIYVLKIIQILHNVNTKNGFSKNLVYFLTYIYIYMSEMKEHRNPSLDSREYRNFVT